MTFARDSFIPMIWRDHGTSASTALERGTPFELELRARRKDGQHRWFLIRYNPLRDEEGRIIRWYSTGTDIDDRKRAEERMQNENFALREEIDHCVDVRRNRRFVGSAAQGTDAGRAKWRRSDSTVLIAGRDRHGQGARSRAPFTSARKRASRAF